MSTTKEELVAANIRQQIAYLEGLLKELEGEPTRSKEIALHIRDVENQLHKLRSQMDY